MELDYTIICPTQRTTHIKSQLKSNPQANPHLLEYYASYILYADNAPTNTTNSTIDIDLMADILAEPTTPTVAYSNPKPAPPNWNSPELISRHQSIGRIKTKVSQLTAQGHLHDAYILRKLARELTIEGGYISSIQPKPYAPTQPPHPIEWDALIDWANPFHIKQIIKLYSSLKQSDHSWEAMDYFDALCTKAQLKPWQEYILLRTIDGANQITMGLELNAQFNRAITPSALSQAKRTIYASIAKAAAIHQLEHFHRNNPSMWIECAKCKQCKLKHKHYFHRLECGTKPLERASKPLPKICKACSTT